MDRNTRKLNRYVANFIDETDATFTGFKGVRDNIARKWREEGIGASVKHTEAFSREEEQKLWQNVLLGVDTPHSLANAVLFSKQSQHTGVALSNCAIFQDCSYEEGPIGSSYTTHLRNVQQLPITAPACTTVVLYLVPSDLSPVGRYSCGLHSMMRINH